jgi:hypothetical protein
MQRLYRAICSAAAAAIATGLLGPLVTPALAQQRTSLDAVSVHLFLEKSAQWSGDVTAIAGFKSWNGTPMGAGLPEDDRFQAVLIQVRLAAKGELFARGPQATVTVSDSRRRRVLLHRQIADVYVDAGGKTTKLVFLPDAACAPLDIRVTGGGRTIAKKVNIDCGE